MSHNLVPVPVRVSPAHMSRSEYQKQPTLNRSLFKSVSESHLRVIMQPSSLTAPVFLVQVECAPQQSHTKLMMIISVKQGTLVWHIFICPGTWHEWHGTSKITGSYFMNYFYSNGLVKLILLPVFFSSSCCSYYLALSTLQPIAISYSMVRGTLVMCRFLSILGAQGFLMKELPLGSLMRMLTGNLPPLAQSLIFAMNSCIFWYCSGYLYLRYYWLSCRSSPTLLSNPSKVVISGFLILGIYSSSSSIHTCACSEMMISRLRSSLLRALNRISKPQSGSCPANCTSLLRNPHLSQWKDVITISLKKGILVSSSLVSPFSKQLMQTLSIIVASLSPLMSTNRVSGCFFFCICGTVDSRLCLLLQKGNLEHLCIGQLIIDLASSMNIYILLQIWALHRLLTIMDPREDTIAETASNKAPSSEAAGREYKPVYALLGDIGGTNMRFSLVLIQPPLNEEKEKVKKQTYQVKEQDNFQQAVRKFLADVPADKYPEVAVMGVAGPVEDNRVELSNVSKWGELDGGVLAVNLKIGHFVFLNDFIANSYGLLLLPEDNFVSLNGLQVNPKNTRGVLGPGTGLGNSIIFSAPFRKRSRVYVLPSEGGHTDTPYINALTSEYLEYLAQKIGHAYVGLQYSFCGPAIPHMYSFLAQKHPELAATADPTSEHIISSYLSDPLSDTLFRRTVDFFLQLYSTAICNFIIHHMCTGGVYLVGSLTNAVLPRLKELDVTGRYRERHPEIGKLLAKVPIVVSKEVDLGLRGAYVYARRIIADQQHQ